MHNVTIKTLDNITAATEWCLDNLDQDEWEIEYVSMMVGPIMYEFRFANPEIASIVSLKWL
jgi:hypothetical protein